MRRIKTTSNKREREKDGKKMMNYPKRMNDEKTDSVHFSHSPLRTKKKSYTKKRMIG